MTNLSTRERRAFVRRAEPAEPLPEHWRADVVPSTKGARATGWLILATGMDIPTWRQYLTPNRNGGSYIQHATGRTHRRA